jgi:hypothetical protein
MVTSWLKLGLAAPTSVKDNLFFSRVINVWTNWAARLGLRWPAVSQTQGKICCESFDILWEFKLISREAAPQTNKM